MQPYGSAGCAALIGKHLFTSSRSLSNQSLEVICKKGVFKNPQNLHKSTCATVSFIMKLQAGALQFYPDFGIGVCEFS